MRRRTRYGTLELLTLERLPVLSTGPITTCQDEWIGCMGMNLERFSIFHCNWSVITGQALSFCIKEAKYFLKYLMCCLSIFLHAKTFAYVCVDVLRTETPSYSFEVSPITVSKRKSSLTFWKLAHVGCTFLNLYSDNRVTIPLNFQCYPVKQRFVSVPQGTPCL